MSNEVKNHTVYMLCRVDKTGDDGTDVYVGSTSQTLGQRLSGHKKHAQNPINGGNRLYKWMNEVGLQNWEMVPLLTFACDKKPFLSLRNSGSI